MLRFVIGLTLLVSAITLPLHAPARGEPPAVDNGLPDFQQQLEELLHRWHPTETERRHWEEQAGPRTPPVGHPDPPVSPETFRQISTTHHASGVGAIVAQRWSPLHGASPRAGLCWVVLEEVRSEGNVGSLIRTSEAIGGAGFILVGARIDPFDPAIVRASMGALFQQTFHPDEQR
jgi:hypothetical protein